MKPDTASSAGAMESRRPVNAKPTGIKEIAQALGVSIGTVDRALHQRPGISPMTRAKVLKMAQTMGYRPNLAARFLKSQRQLQISVQLPSEIAAFFDPLREGIREAAALLEPAVRLEMRNYPRLGEGDAEVFNDALERGVQGMIIAPGAPSEMRALIRRAARRNIPVVCVSTDAPGTERLTAVTACPYSSGAIAGELLCRILRGPAKVLVITGGLGTEDHASKIEGFRASLQAGNGIGIERLVEAHDDEQLAYSGTKSALADFPDLGGVYVSTSNSLPVLQAIEEAGLSGKLAVITTDLFAALVPLIRSGRILATIHQRPMTQGRLACRALYRFIAEGQCPLPRIRVAPHIVMTSNLDLFLEQMALPAEGSGDRDEPIWNGAAASVG
ncbi:MAG TPA: LacI family DNA-binding transcriptional regulator [Bryobacteraceae bacterium]|nr:LacI family DNA-binding transcriptional regulator [Bryobacteraceae bacterium]